MSRSFLQPHVVLITATGRDPITITFRPVSVLLGLALGIGLPALWINHLTRHNHQLVQEHETLSHQANQVLTDLQAITDDVEQLKNRAGLSTETVDRERQDTAEGLSPQGGLAKVASVQTILNLSKTRIDGLEAVLNNAVKPGLEITLTSETRRKSAFPQGKPIAGPLEVSSEFGLRPSPFGGLDYEIHDGIDFAGPVGKPVLATADGTVLQAEYDSGYGNHVKLDHGYGYTTLYAHLSRTTVQPGDWVERGNVVGYLGNTGRSSGPHLHYGIYRQGQSVNPRHYLGLGNAPFDNSP
jgi:murein DD-endopeptidase MepM/ murein hydrolase activator NlpD